MLTRHVVLLGILHEAPRPPSRTELMKWLFLMRAETCLSREPAFYDFVPYKYGPFSFLVYRDLAVLSVQGHLADGKLELSRNGESDALRRFGSLPGAVRNAVFDVLRRYGTLRRQELVEKVYRAYPWFASRSGRRAVKPPATKARKAVYTIGYEGESVDRFFQRLVKFGIEGIVDVRCNPLSRKYGFSKSALHQIANKLGITYHHFRELGIPSALRRDLTAPNAYARLFREYERRILPNAHHGRDSAAQVLRSAPSALLCYEADAHYCHRSRLATVLSKETGMEVVHL
jgi:hypothetical protein